MFSSFISWSRSELFYKWTDLRCTFCPRQPFQYTGDLTTHLIRDHENECNDLIKHHDEGSLGALLVRLADDAKQAAAARKIKLSACLFCDLSEKDGDMAVDKQEFMAHVGRHMEELAFETLCPPGQDYFREENDWRSSVYSSMRSTSLKLASSGLEI